MAVNRVDAEREIAAPPDRVFQRIADLSARARWLPPNYSDIAVDQSDSALRYRLKVGNRERAYHMAVSESRPGSVLSEKDTGSSLTTTWTVTPSGSGSRVAIHTEWQGSGGVGGFFERLFAPAGLKRVYVDALGRLDRDISEARGGV